MKRSIVFSLALILILISSGCIQEEEPVEKTCEPPEMKYYTEYGPFCCMDENANNICDNREIRKSLFESCSYDVDCQSNICLHKVCRSDHTFCGDDYCDAGENASNCYRDCVILEFGDFRPKNISASVDGEIYTFVIGDDYTFRVNPTILMPVYAGKKEAINVSFDYVCDTPSGSLDTSNASLAWRRGDLENDLVSIYSSYRTDIHGRVVDLGYIVPRMGQGTDIWLDFSVWPKYPARDFDVWCTFRFSSDEPEMSVKRVLTIMFR